MTADRLQSKRSRARETRDQRDERLAGDHLRKQRSRAEGKLRQRTTRLTCLRHMQAQRLAAESGKQRAARLQQLTSNQAHCLAAETEEQRRARLAHFHSNQAHRWTTSHRHLQNVQHTFSLSACDEYLHHGKWLTDTILLHKLWVMGEMGSFHAMQRQWERRSCNVCHERWPTCQKLSASEYICVRCSPSSVYCIYCMHLFSYKQ